MNLRRKTERFLRRLFHRKKKRTRLTKAELKLMESHLQMHHDMIAKERVETMTIDGKDYEAAVEKFTEFMMVKSTIEIKGLAGLDEAPLTETPVYDDIPVVRVSKIPELLLLLGVRIKG
jgi:hypothetical protein